MKHQCEWCGKDTWKVDGGGHGHYYCSRECSDASRKNKTKLRNRGYLMVMGADGVRHRTKVNKRPRPETCELCGRVPGRLHYHHWNDAKPEQGIWVCIPCHQRVEYYEKGMIDAYLKLKQTIIDGRDGV